MLLIGSRALMIRAPKSLLRSPRDFDFICRQHELEDWVKKMLPGKKLSIDPDGRHASAGIAEFEIAVPGSSAEALLELTADDPGTLRLKSTSWDIPSFDVLFALKKSHRFLKNSVHFWKTLGDYHMMKRLGAVVPDGYTAWFKQRENETYTYSHPKLNKGKSDFFSDDQIKYVYDHDTVHEAVKLFDRPAYTMFQKDGAEVQVDRSKFDSLSYSVQLASVVEESAVLAIERSLVPYPGVLTEEQAWRLAFSKVLTSITSGWWRTFAYENALDALKLYPKNYWERFRAAVEAGVVKKIST